MRRPPFDLASRRRARGGSAGSPGRRGERGAITWITLLLLGAVASAAYLAWVWGPVYVVHYEVKQVVRQFMNQAVHNRNDAELIENMVHKLATLEKVDGLDEYGDVARVPAVVIDPRSVTWDRDGGDPPTLRVAFDYERTVTYPILERSASRVLSIDLETDLSIPDWGPSR